MTVQKDNGKGVWSGLCIASVRHSLPRATHFCKLSYLPLIPQITGDQEVRRLWFCWANEIPERNRVGVPDLPQWVSCRHHCVSKCFLTSLQNGERPKSIIVQCLLQPVGGEHRIYCWIKVPWQKPQNVVVCGGLKICHYKSGSQFSTRACIVIRSII